MMYLGIALICLAIAPGIRCNDDILSFMSREEIRQVFQADYDSVPKYEITNLHVSEKLHKRDLHEDSIQALNVRAFGESINLWLHPGQSVLAGEDTPVYFAKYLPGEPENVKFWHRDGLMGMVGRIYEDPDWRASFVIGTTESGSANVNGHIASKNLAVRALPARAAKEYRTSLQSDGDSNDVNAPVHVVFQTAENYDKRFSLLPINATALRHRIAARTEDGSIPDTIYPEVLVVVEYSLYRTFGRDIYSLLQYILAFFNGIDLKYRSMEEPNIRFHISGIILAEDPQATPYISRHSLGPDVFNTHEALPDSTKFFYAVKDTFPLGSYDIPITMTSQKFGINGNEFILGQAWVGYVCKKDDQYQTVNSVTIIHDDGVFSGIHVAAHEIGHLIGARHDTDKTGKDCLFTNGFLMSFTPWYTTNSSDFSTCSIDAIEETLNEAKLDCLFNPPPYAGKSIPELMPGRIKNLEEQCKSLDCNAPCQNPDGPTNVCVNIFCIDKNGRCVGTGSAAVDGTTCGDDKFCLHEQCVSL